MENESTPEKKKIDNDQIARDFLEEVKNRPNSPIREIKYPDSSYKMPIDLPSDVDGISFYLDQIATWQKAPIILDSFEQHEDRRAWKTEVLYKEAEEKFGRDAANRVNNLFSSTKMSAGAFKDMSQFVDFMDGAFTGEKPQEFATLIGKINNITTESITLDDEDRYDKLADGFIAKNEKDRIIYIAETSNLIDKLMQHYDIPQTLYEPLTKK